MKSHLIFSFPVWLLALSIAGPAWADTAPKSKTKGSGGTCWHMGPQNQLIGLPCEKNPGCDVLLPDKSVVGLVQGVLDARALTFYLKSPILTYSGAALKADFGVGAVTPNCDASGQIAINAITLHTARWQYTFKHSGADHMGMYHQADAPVPGSDFATSLQYKAGVDSTFSASFKPYAADHITPQSSPLGSSPYCAVSPWFFSIDYTVDGLEWFAEVDLEYPNRGIQFRSGGKESCPTTNGEACLYDPKIALSEVCRPALRVGTFCVSDYRGDLSSLQFCGHAGSFLDEMISQYHVQFPVDSFYQDWLAQFKITALPEFTGNDSAGGNSVDVLFVGTHGGVDKTDATLALWSSGEKILTNSDNVRLGEFPGRASLLVLDSCWVLSGNNVDAGNAHVDGDKFDGSGVDQPVKSGWMFNRWGKVFKGGLRIAVGGADGEIMFDGIYGTNYNPVDFVGKLADRSIADAFMDAWDNWAVDQHVGGVASGKTSSGCLDRLLNMRLSTMNNYPRLYDDDVKYLCQVHVFHD
jgi:hypothetical protein